MPDIEDMTPGQVLAEASVADFIKSLGLSIAEAQKALDENSINQMGEFITPRDGLGGKSLLDIGLMPAFYHYQHADITCSMQLSLRVEKNIGVGVNINGSFNDTQSNESSSSNSSTSTESGSSTRTQSRSARVTIQSTSAGALTVGGQNYQLQGNTPRERITALAETVRGREDITRAIPVENCTPITPTPTTSAPPAQVLCTPNSVTFLGGGGSRGWVRISSNPSNANSPQNYKMNDSVNVDVPRGTNKLTFANAVRDNIDGTVFSATLYPAGEPIDRVFFGVDLDIIRPNEDQHLEFVAELLKATGLEAKINGYASRTASDSHNDDLSRRRAARVKARLVSLGVEAGKLTEQHFGEDRWRGENVPDEFEHQPHRVVEVVLESTDHFIRVQGDSTNLLVNVEPDKLSGGGGNGWVQVTSANTFAALNGETVTIKGQTFTLSGTAVASHPADSGAAFALNLANAVNANSSVQVAASASSNITHLCNAGDNYELILVTETSTNIELSGSSGVTVTESFSRTTSSSGTQENTGNRTVAVGASLDVRYGRQFEMNVTGNSSISARLVSIPAPPAFLETIKDFLEQSDGN